MRKGLFLGQTSSLERLLALTDGIYAMALTILVFSNDAHSNWCSVADEGKLFAKEDDPA